MFTDYMYMMKVNEDLQGTNRNKYMKQRKKKNARFAAAAKKELLRQKEVGMGVSIEKQLLAGN
jgi:hypothetical protein